MRDLEGEEGRRSRGGEEVAVEGKEVWEVGGGVGEEHKGVRRERKLGSGRGAGGAEGLRGSCEVDVHALQLT